MHAKVDLLYELRDIAKRPIRIAISQHQCEMAWLVMRDVEGADFGTEHVKRR